MSERVLVAMSGGVDSSVAALMLKESGHDVVGVFMRNGVSTEGVVHRRSCCSVEDAHDARRVADMIGIPFYVLNFQEEFEGIIRSFVEDYNRGLTPNPCILCNRDLKFGKLFGYAKAVGAEQVATGHYAIVAEEAERGWSLKKARDDAKDQSYVLFPLRRGDLRNIRFPLGALLKVEVREIARRKGLPVKDKPESQDICFVPDDNYGNLIMKVAPDSVREGEIRGVDGKAVGRHRGHQFFTIGQRKGIGAHGHPMYVVDIDAGTNTVTIGEDGDVHAPGMEVAGVNWLGCEPPTAGASFPWKVKIRHRHTPAEATVTVGADGAALVRFADPQRAITPGQAAVFYDGDIVMGGGWIGRVARGEVA